MYMIVVGGGKVGLALTQALLASGHEVLCLEIDPHRCSVLTEELGGVVFRGDGCEAATLDEAGAARADVLIAVTGDDEDNLVACQVAKHRFKVGRTIARINNPKNKTIFRLLGVDATVNSTEIIMAQITQELPVHPLVALLSFSGMGLDLVHVEIPPDARVVGQKLSDLSLPSGSTIALVIEADKTVRLAAPDLALQGMDEVVAVTHPEDEETLREILTSPA